MTKALAAAALAIGLAAPVVSAGAQSTKFVFFRMPSNNYWHGFFLSRQRYSVH